MPSVMSLCGKMIAIMKRMKTTGRTGYEEELRKGRCLRKRASTQAQEIANVEPCSQDSSMVGV